MQQLSKIVIQAHNSLKPCLQIISSDDKITYKKASVIIEFYPLAILNVFIFVSLLIRRKKIIEAGHIRHHDYPNSYKSKLVFLVLWLFILVVQATLCFVSSIHHKKYWIE